MKILVLCYEYPPIGGGGGRVAAQVAKELVRRGHEVRLITSGMRHLPGRFNDDGVEVFREPSFRRREDTCSVPEMGLYLLTNFLPALRQVRDWQPDVVHAHFAVPTGVLALALHLFTRKPYVITAHLGDVPGGVPEQTAGLFKLVNPFVRQVWKHCARVTAVSTFVGNLARKAYNVDPVVILNAVRMERAVEVQPNPAPRLLFVGRLSLQKNPLLAVEALAAVRDLPWSLEVIGEGPLGQAMKEKVGELQLTDRISFRGWLPGAEVGAKMAQSDILLMTSLHEGLPMVAVEALHHGLAIIGSDIGGMQDVVDEGRNGHLCALTPEACADKLRQVLSSPERLTAQRRASAEKAQAFDLPRSIDRYEEVLTEATRDRA